MLEWQRLVQDLDLVPEGDADGSGFGRYLVPDLEQARRVAERVRGTLCTLSLWGSEWWCHEGVRDVQPVGYVVGRSVPAGFRRRLPEPDPASGPTSGGDA